MESAKKLPYNACVMQEDANSLKELWKIDSVPNQQFKKVHMIGAAGLGMNALKKWLQSRNYMITETDDYNPTASMIPSNQIPNADCVVVSSVIPKNHPQCIWAVQNDIPIFHRASFVKYLLGDESICVSGSHGKTTTSGLIAWIFYCAEYNPSFILGDKIRNLNSASQYNDHSDMFDSMFATDQSIPKIDAKQHIYIAESDESDGSMQKLSGKVNVITNIDEDHMDYYRNRENLFNAFKNFANSGEICVCHCNVQNMLDLNNAVTYSIEQDSHADIYATNVKFHENGMLFNVDGKIVLDNVYLNISGKYNVENALAAICVATHYQIHDQHIKEALSTFQGMNKRMETNIIDNVSYMLDYAHHPHAIKLLFDTINNAKYNAMHVIFEIHKYSRLLKDFNLFIEIITNLRIERGANIIILPIHRVHEEFDFELESKFYHSILTEIELHNSGFATQTCQIDHVKTSNCNPLNYGVMQIKSHNIDDQFQFIDDFIKMNAQPNDLVVFIGAGQICKLYYKFIEILQNR